MVVRFRNVVMAYFIIGAVMYGGGVISYQDAGMTNLIVEDEQGDLNEGLIDQLDSLPDVLKETLDSVGASALLAVIDIVLNIMEFVFWPIVVLQAVGAPFVVVLLFGGSLVVALFVGFLGFLRGI